MSDIFLKKYVEDFAIGSCKNILKSLEDEKHSLEDKLEILEIVMSILLSNFNETRAFKYLNKLVNDVYGLREIYLKELDEYMMKDSDECRKQKKTTK